MAAATIDEATRAARLAALARGRQTALANRKAKLAQQRREARGVRVVSTDAQPSEPKPVTRKPVSKPAGDSNAVKLWRLLIG